MRWKEIEGLRQGESLTILLRQVDDRGLETRRKCRELCTAVEKVHGVILDSYTDPYLIRECGTADVFPYRDDETCAAL